MKENLKKMTENIINYTLFLPHKSPRMPKMSWPKKVPTTAAPFKKVESRAGTERQNNFFFGKEEKKAYKFVMKLLKYVNM